MKTSWIIGIMSLYLLILGAELMLTEGTAFSAGTREQMQTLLSPVMANYSNTTTAFASTIINGGAIIMTFLNAVFLYSPTLFASYGMWFWFYICLPIAVGTIISIVQVFRGVPAG